MYTRNSGFSLIELMVVISLCLLLMGGAVVISRAMRRAVILSEINLFCAACSYLQQQAIATGTMQELVFDVNAHSYSCNGHTHALAQQVVFGVPPQVYGPPSAPHKLLTEPISFADNTICFYPEGIMSAGMVCFSDRQHKIVYAICNGVAHVSYMRRYCYEKKWRLLS